MNYMKQVAEMLGVELGEEFELKDIDTGDVCNGKYRLSERGLEYCDNYDGEWFGSGLLNSLLIGNDEIVKLPYKPKVGDKAWTVMLSIHSCKYFATEEIYAPHRNLFDALRAELGLWYRTEAEAEADLPRVQALVDKWTKRGD